MRPETLPLIPLVVVLLVGCQSQPLPDPCYEPPESGRCDDSLQRYYFHPDWQECRPFIWGGCDDGSVPFESEEECLRLCEAPARGDR